MFGNNSDPSRIYSYGASAPTVGLDKVVEQMYLAHKYRNNLVDLERRRRAEVDKLLAQLVPGLAAVEDELAKAEEAFEEADAAVKREHSGSRSRKTDKASSDRLKAARKHRDALRCQRQELRAAAFATEVWQAKQREIDGYSVAPKGKTKGGKDKTKKVHVDGWCDTEKKRLYAESGVFWGTRLQVVASMKDARKGAPPEIKYFNGRGHLAVQIQKDFSVADLMNTEGTFAHVIRRPEGIWCQGKRRPRKLGTALARFRIDSDAKGKPVFAEIPFTLHRDMPEDAEVTWVHLIRKRVGTHDRWFIQFTLSRKDGWNTKPKASSGVVGIDVGWRVMDDRRLRVAVWKGSDGRSGELALPAWVDHDGEPRSWIDGYRKTEFIQSDRDVDLNQAKSELLTYLKGRGEDLPEFLLEARKTLHAWKSPARFARLVLRWRRERQAEGGEALAGLDEMLAKLDAKTPPGRHAVAWRVRDRHLYEYQANLRDRLQARRLDEYRCFAAKMSREYACAILEGMPSAKDEKDEKKKRAEERKKLMDLRDFHELPMPEEPPGAVGEKGSRAKEHVRDACLSELRRCLVEVMPVDVRPAPKTTIIHAECGSEEIWDHTVLMHTCSQCGVTYDQDMNAAENLISPASGHVVAVQV